MQACLAAEGTLSFLPSLYSITCNLSYLSSEPGWGNKVRYYSWWDVDFRTHVGAGDCKTAIRVHSKKQREQEIPVPEPLIAEFGRIRASRTDKATLMHPSSPKFSFINNLSNFEQIAKNPCRDNQN